VSSRDKATFVQPSELNPLLFEFPTIDWAWRRAAFFRLLPFATLIVLFGLERVGLASLTKRIMPWSSILPATVGLLGFIACTLALGSEWEVREKRSKPRKLVMSSRGLTLTWIKRVFVPWRKVDHFKFSPLSNPPGSTLLEINFSVHKRKRCWRMIIPTIGSRDELSSALSSFEISPGVSHRVEIGSSLTSPIPELVHSVGNFWRPAMSLFLTFNGVILVLLGLTVLITPLFVTPEVRTSDPRNSVRIGKPMVWYQIWISLLSGGSALTLAGVKIGKSGIMTHSEKHSDRNLGPMTRPPSRQKNQRPQWPSLDSKHPCRCRLLAKRARQRINW
jgi:hypothetical protein